MTSIISDQSNNAVIVNAVPRSADDATANATTTKTNADGSKTIIGHSATAVFRNPA